MCVIEPTNIETLLFVVHCLKTLVCLNSCIHNKQQNGSRSAYSSTLLADLEMHNYTHCKVHAAVRNVNKEVGVNIKLTSHLSQKNFYYFTEIIFYQLNFRQIIMHD